MNAETGDIFIDGQPFRVNIATFKAKDIIDFAPRATVPGNSGLMSDLSLYQPLVQTDWQHGIGFHWYSDSAGYLTTVGNVDTRHDGLAMMFTQAVQNTTYDQPKRGMTIFEGDVYAWGDYGLFKFSETFGWMDVYTTGKVNYALNSGDYLLFAPDGARVKKMAADGTITDAGLDASSTDYRWMIIHNGFIYAGKSDSNIVHFDSNSDLSQLEGTTADPEKISCGVGNMPTIGAVVYAGNLYVSRPDGLWMIGEDKIARNVLDFTDSMSDNNFKSMSVVNGYLLFPIRDRIIQWNAYRTANVTPSRITDEFPYVNYIEFENFVSADNFLFCTAKTNEPVPTLSLLCWDGVGWHKLLDIVENVTLDTDICTMLAYESINNRLWMFAQEGMRYIQMQPGTFPYANFPTTGSHSLITSRLDMGFRRVTKSTPSMFAEARNVTDDRYIRVSYSIDGDVWVEWDKLTDNGVTELLYPGGYSTIEYNYLMIKFDFVTDDSSQSPVLEGFTINFLMRPIVKMGYTFQIVAATGFEQDNFSDERTAAEIVRSIRHIRNSRKPVSFVGLLGDEVEGYLTSIGETPIYRSESDVEYVIQCSFVETFDAGISER